MLLTERFSKEFSASTRSNGSIYVSEGRVRIVSADEWKVEARVTGSQNYDTDIWWEGTDLVAQCTCPHFGSGYACKHLWATLLTADEKHFLAGDGKEPVHFFLDFSLFDSVDDDEYDDDEFDDDEPPFTSLSKPAVTKKEEWRQQLGFTDPPQTSPPPDWPANRKLIYAVDILQTLSSGFLTLEVLTQEPKKNGELSKPRQLRLPRFQIPHIPDSNDRQILGILNGAIETSQDYYGYSESAYDTALCRYRLMPAVLEYLIPLLCKTARFFLKTQSGISSIPLRWDEGDPWQFFVRVRRNETERFYIVDGYLRRDQESVDLATPVLALAAGFVFFQESACRLDHGNAFPWIKALRTTPSVTVPEKQIDKFLQETLTRSHSPRLDLPEQLHYESIVLPPQPCLTFQNMSQAERPTACLSFLYGDDLSFQEEDPKASEYDAKLRRLYARDLHAESIARQQLNAAGFKPFPSGYSARGPRWEISPKSFPSAVRELSAQHWRVEAEGKLFRNPGEFRIEVSSGIDWFELHGSVDYGDISISLPELLATARRGNHLVLLSDGTYGILPEDWLNKYGMFAEAGESAENHVRFQKSQIGLLNALLASQPEVHVDKTFAAARKELLQFEGIKAVQAPKSFQGTLRHYQKEALGWTRFLRRFGFGGCLADDMGLGKTVTVLALLEERRKLREKAGDDAPLPSLVVVPRSLVFNWKLEAARFTPLLRVLDHTGMSRIKGTEHFEDYDLVLTTYGTLRNDAVFFKDLRFDYIILDEAQAIKNADTVSAKAARLLQGSHKLALSGTPVENHLGELWSLFEFLNPGMLGSARVFKMTGSIARNPDEQTRQILAQALRPFILRRTKQQVLKELPPKTEQTIYCELESAQRKAYDELRDYYRALLLRRVDSEGINKSKIYVLEALLRLRQAACHMGLIDQKRIHEPSAKLDTLIPQLLEVLSENHKILVFSQFTSFLSILRGRLEREGLAYEYLDGQTTNRQAPVEKFQTDPGSKLFLISLKAGGLGLNLTAAEYVFLLDPWWNPVAEAQAVDRAHRIGQNRRVFAYRLIARDTVEEKVLELQKTKRDLADAIINADNSLIRNLAREDLELLLS